VRACTSVGTVKRDGGHRLALPAAAGNDHTDSAATTPTCLAGAAPAALGMGCHAAHQQQQQQLLQEGRCRAGRGGR
jgi:uncharacterized protein HemX